MNRHIPQKLKSTVRRTLALLLAASTLSGNIVAAETDEQALRELYGSDWQKVAALQPGDSYISGDTMYICTEETYVDWKRVRSKADLNT